MTDAVCFGYYTLQAIIVAVLAGQYADSWYVGLAVAAAFVIVPLKAPQVAKPVGVLLGISWGWTGWTLGEGFGRQDAQIVIAALFALTGIGANLGGIDYLRRQS